MRFARAKGSKASNERVAEEATPWSEMKQQLVDKSKEVNETKKRQQAEAQRQDNYKQFLQEKEESEKKHTEWAVFPGVSKSPKKNKKTSKKTFNLLLKKNPDSFKDNDKEAPEECSAKIKVPQVVVQKVKNKRKPVKIACNIGDQKSMEKTMKANKQQGVEQMSSKNAIKEELTEQDVHKIEKKKQKALRQRENRKKKLKLQNGLDGKTDESSTGQQRTEFKGKFDKTQNKRFMQTKSKNSKSNGGKEKKERRKALPNQFFINGKAVEISYLDGFPIKREDADRIHQLRREMISKGLPRSEIRTALKLERRKAEKAFAREKKKVCFNCRKSGHNLSECPDLGKDEKGVIQSSGTGICFKCGSTEHTHFECKIVRGQVFKHAQCFICQEQGHIAKQCPDNPRGLYPKGGACNICGDVTHMKKDCPKYQAQINQESSNFGLDTIDHRNPDDIGDNSPCIKEEQKINKIIQF